MAYLQNGQCFSTSAGAKADYVSRVIGDQQRNDALVYLAKLSESELQAFFPPCIPDAVMFGLYLSALLSLVALCMSISYIKKAAYL